MAAQQRITHLARFWVALPLLVAACNSTARRGSDDARPAGGLVVLQTNYRSTSVSLVSSDGKQVRQGVLTSDSVSDKAIVPLSGDLVLSSEPSLFGKVHLIDRTNDTITEIDPITATVLDQFSVRTAFARNTHDFIERDPRHAYATLYDTDGSNLGGDVAIIEDRAVVGYIRLDIEGSKHLPRAESFIRVGDGKIAVLQQRFLPDFSAADTSELAILSSTDTVERRVDLQLANCYRYTRSPSGQTLLFSCTGVPGADEHGSRAGFALVDAQGLTRVSRLIRYSELSQKLGRDVARVASVAFHSESSLAGIATGSRTESTHDFAFTYDLNTRECALLAEGGDAYSLGDVACDPADIGHCAHADGERNVVQLWSLDNRQRRDPLDVSLDDESELRAITLHYY